MRILMFDTETTGFAPPAILQLAGVVLHSDDKKNFREVASFNVMVKDGYDKVEPGAEAVHGISKDFANAHGISLRSAYALFALYAQGADLIVAHNIEFDAGKAIPHTAKTLGLPDVLQGKKQFCTMKETTDLCRIPSTRGFKWPKLQELHHFLFGCNFESAHDAMADVQAMKRCFFELVLLGHFKL